MNEEEKAALLSSFNEMKSDISRFRENIYDLRQDMQANTHMTEAMWVVFQEARSGFKVLGYLGTALKWIGSIAAAIGACIALIGKIRGGWL